MTVLTFLPRFHDQVRDGRKPNTIRAPRKRPIHVGDRLSLRRWTGRPYNSKQEVLREAVCTRLHLVTIWPDRVEKGAEVIDTPEGLHDFARSDGFKDWPDMRTHFGKRLPFTGTMIGWTP